MYIQETIAWSGDVEGRLALLKTLGVDHIAIHVPHTSDPTRGVPFLDLSSVASATASLARAKAMITAHGLQLRTVFAISGFDAIKRGLPGRDEKIAEVLNLITAMGENEVPILAYNFKLLVSKHLRSQPMPGRGAAHYVSFDYDEYLKNPAAPISPPITEAQMWDNLSTFLKAAVPVAEQAGVRLALHPDDPPLPAGIPALAGAANIVSTFEHYRKIFDNVPSSANGMLFCQGCVKEMQNVDVYQAIRAMGTANKIVMVHFRNVKGAFPRFQETFVDDGDVDMFRAMQAYRDAGFKGPYALDHSPEFAHSEIANQAFVIGYIRGLIQAVYR